MCLSLNATNCIKTLDGSVLLTDKDISSVFNEFFITTLKPTALSLPQPVTCTGNVTFSVNEVEAELLALKEDSAWGPDQIPSVFLKNCASSFALPIFLIFSTSIRTCKFPTRWKDANITPIHKGGSKHDVNNYRPISLLSSISKILERFVHRDYLQTVANSTSFQQHSKVFYLDVLV